MGCLNFESRQEAHTIEQAAMFHITSNICSNHQHDCVNLEQFAMLHAPSLHHASTLYAARHNEFQLLCPALCSNTFALVRVVSVPHCLGQRFCMSISAMSSLDA